MKWKHSAAGTVLALILSASIPLAAESFPPLKDGRIPRDLDALWNGYDPASEPLHTEILREWENDGVVTRLIRYQIGTFKGAASTMAAIYCVPKGGTRLPALLHLHGGGQSASLDGPMADAANGYASLSLNWGGNRIPVPKSIHPDGFWQGPQTDWGKLDATHPPQRNPINHFTGNIAADDFTLDAVESPRNANWFLVLIAARRALTFLEQQAEVDPSRIGVYGHSMGGKLTTNLAGIDRRIRAAVPSCGGCGEIDVSQTELPGCLKTRTDPIQQACVSDNAYLPRISCPILWLSPTQDFHGIIDHMASNWRIVPDELLRLSITPHQNHLHDDAHGLTRHLFFEQHLKQAFALPKTPRLVLHARGAEGIPCLEVTPDDSRPVHSVAIYYSLDPHPTTRFWRHVRAVKRGSSWTAAAPLMSLDQPLFAYADVSYETPPIYQKIARPAGAGDSPTYTISSRVVTAAPAIWKTAGTRATDHADRMIDAGDDGWCDWHRSNWGHPPLWTAATAKIKDPKWRGPKGARLVFEIRSTSDNTLAVVIRTNQWGVFGRQVPATDYVTTRKLKASPDWQTVSVRLEDLVPNDPEVEGPPSDWDAATELCLSPGYQGTAKGRVQFPPKAWQGPREIRKLRWEGGR